MFSCSLMSHANLHPLNLVAVRRLSEPDSSLRSLAGIHQWRRCPIFSARLRTAAAAGPPPPTLEDESSGLRSTLSRFKDRLRVFFAVLFWMSLFFWASAWDGRGGGRKKKGFRFKK